MGRPPLGCSAPSDGVQTITTNTIESMLCVRYCPPLSDPVQNRMMVWMMGWKVAEGSWESGRRSGWMPWLSSA